MIVVEYGFQDEAPKYKRFLTEVVAMDFADTVFACLRDIRVEYTQRHSLMPHFSKRGENAKS